MDSKLNERDKWGSKLGFILAAAGSAVGLGNLWKFPYMAGSYGGGAFVLIYLIILILVGFTLMIAELSLGRHANLNAVGAFKKISKHWSWVGYLGVVASFLILSFYSVVGGWIIYYLVKSITFGFNVSDPNLLSNTFTSLISSSTIPIFYHGIFMCMTLAIVIKGISGGIEKMSKVLMPGLFIMILLTMFRSLTLPGSFEGVKFLLAPDFSMISFEVVVAALGQVFFSIGLGMGGMVTYGSYLDKNENIPQSALAIPLIDTLIAIFAGLAILPAVFAMGLDAAGGPGLVFITLPAVFSEMPFGGVFTILFFLLVLFAALTSSISLLEVCVSFVVDELKVRRSVATPLIAAAIFIAGIPSSLSQGVWAHVTIIGEFNIFDSVVTLADQFLLPIGGFFLCIFVGWVWGVDKAVEETSCKGKHPFPFAATWSFLIKWILPLAIMIVFLQGIIALI